MFILPQFFRCPFCVSFVASSTCILNKFLVFLFLADACACMSFGLLYSFLRSSQLMLGRCLSFSLLILKLCFFLDSFYCFTFLRHLWASFCSNPPTRRYPNTPPLFTYEYYQWKVGLGSKVIIIFKMDFITGHFIF